MKKTIAMLLAGMMLAGALTACGGSSGSSASNAEPAKEETTEAVADTDAAGTAEAAVAADAASTTEAAAPAEDAGRTFTVGFDAEYPPYGFKDEESGDYTGFDLELAEELCKRRGWTLKKQPIDWDSKDMEINSGTIDCLWNGMTYTGREEDYTWSEPYVDNSIVIAVNADSDIQTKADLAGKNVVAQAASSADTALVNDPGDGSNDENLKLRESFASYETIKDYNDAFMNMNAGVYDAIAVDIGVAQYQLAANEGKYRILDEPLSTEQYAIAFAKGNTELRDMVQETLNEMAADGTVDEIVAGYAEYNLPEMLIIGKDK